VLIYRVREGPRVKIRGLQFRGNEAFFLHDPLGAADKTL